MGFAVLRQPRNNPLRAGTLLRRRYPLHHHRRRQDAPSSTWPATSCTSGRRPPPRGPSNGFLRDNGNLLVRCYDDTEPWTGGGYGGVLVELDWDGNVLWRYDNPVIHHDHIVLKNGNIMLIGWEELTAEQEARVRGGRERPRHARPQDASATS